MWPFSRSCGSKARLVGKTIVITGANTGIGKETARDFYKRGARVILACRDTKKAEQTIRDLKENHLQSRGKNDGEPGELKVCHLNLSSLASVKECARNILVTEGALHILVNNAGVMMCPFGKTEDGFETHFQVNHLGHFLLTLLLLPKLQDSAPGCRIINLSSMAHITSSGIKFDDINHEKSYNPWMAYGQSKLANILFTKELARRLEASGTKGINVYAVHPGVVHTELSRHVDTAIFPGARRFYRTVMRRFIKTSVQGAQTTVHCAVDEQAGKETGLYYAECRPTRPTAKARDEKTAKLLWERSCEFVGLKNHADLKEIIPEIATKSCDDSAQKAISI